ncbi:MAG TPA: protein translocase subunit SecD [Acidimicrobiales bacterium]|nr:protein translocase subunit SecD [Acidimicrobiales bacterium]HLN42941.1 protein translocase subunit SecD [Acidimicrobiales bacterium]
MKRSLVISLGVTLTIAIVAFAATLGAGWSPKLGLDLAGGSEVVYKPTKAISSGDMNTTVNIIRNRVDSAGVSGAIVNAQGGNVVVQFPGVKDPQTLIKLIGKTAQLYFRPVLCGAPVYAPPLKGKSPPSGPLPSCGQYATTAANLNVNTSTQQPTNNIPANPAFAPYPSTVNDDANAVVLLPTDPTSGAQQFPRFVLAKASLKGNAIASASAVFDTTISQWAVSYNLRAVTPWDQVAQANFHQYVAIDLDGVVESAPLIQPGLATFSSFNGKGEISGNFTQQTAKNLALELNYGSLPVPLKILTQETVSPSLGKSSLKAGLLAGIGGLLLVLIYTILYYRVLGIVVVAGLLTTAALLWAIVSALSHSALNLTLDLSGVTGVIVSVGITVDSYIVYFERLKDEARSGRSVRTSVDRSFRGAFRTVLAADLVSLAAAVVLYILAVGTVRGFAFFLGLSTLLDIFTTFFFTRPLVILLGRSSRITEARVIGVARGLAIGSESPA